MVNKVLQDQNVFSETDWPRTVFVVLFSLCLVKGATSSVRGVSSAQYLVCGLSLGTWYWSSTGSIGEEPRAEYAGRPHVVCDGVGTRNEKGART